MSEDDKERIAALLTKTIAMMCVRNSMCAYPVNAHTHNM